MIMNISQLGNILESLSKRRPIFHSEADFQHELAIELKIEGFSCRLERPVSVKYNGKEVTAYVDILAKCNNGEKWTAIELKYVTVKLDYTHGGERFTLANNWGPNLSRFDCLADWLRVSKIVESRHAENGYSIYLTNSEKAWSDNIMRLGNLGAAFSIHGGREICANDQMDWPKGIKLSSVSDKRLNPYAPIVAPSNQVIKWVEYSNFAVSNGILKYLILSPDP
jgi:hypothetical protein